MRLALNKDGWGRRHRTPCDSAVPPRLACACSAAYRHATPRLIGAALTLVQLHITSQLMRSRAHTQTHTLSVTHMHLTISLPPTHEFIGKSSILPGFKKKTSVHSKWCISVLWAMATPLLSPSVVLLLFLSPFCFYPPFLSFLNFSLDLHRARSNARDA
jgi:hypothetical protein